jgi:Tfp pilus assembly PilM family ATPase
VSLRLLGLPPQLAGAELRALLHRREASLGLPFPLGEAELDGELKEGGTLGAFMASEAIDRWIQTFTVAGLELHGLEPATLSLGRALAGVFQTFASDDWLGVLDLQASRWDLGLWLAGLPRFQLSFDPQTGPEQIQGLLALFQRQGRLTPRGELAQLWLVGPGADDPAMATQLGECLACPVAPADPQAAEGLQWADSWQMRAPASLTRLLGLLQRGKQR